MVSKRTLIFCIFAVFSIAAERVEEEKIARSRIERCARQFDIVLNFLCRGIDEEDCEPFRYIIDLDETEMSVVRERVLERKCCRQRCSIQVLRSLCCLQR
ncbi:unnamed protein product [Cylicocyclus nassatus]|uniref:Uncharacterized protein n=1 Tax=Cylicocyclus nassatus TaxID=53992 RepID=A0AA36HI76_CYLNA|nr:unnamed protein product [Cylicocyclus nassatus]